MSEQVLTLSEEEYEKIIQGKEKLEKEGYRIDEHGEFLVVVMPSGEKYIFRKPAIVEKEVTEITLPREGKRYKARIKNIVISQVYKLLARKGYNVENILKNCEKYQDLKDRYYCVRRLQDIGYLIEFEVPELQLEDFDIIRFTVHKNSRYRELARCYKMFKKGMEVEVMLTEKGRLRIVCPEVDEK